jgi:hypothetical protein
MVKITAELVRQRSCRLIAAHSLYSRVLLSFVRRSHTSSLIKRCCQRAGSAAFAAPDAWAAADEADGVDSSISAASAAAAPVECDLHMCQLAAVPAFDEKRLLVSVRLIHFTCTRAALQYLLNFDPTHLFLPTIVQSLNAASSQSDAATPPLCIASLNLSTNLLTSSPPAAASSSSSAASSSLLHLADLGASLRSLGLARNMLDRLVTAHFAPLVALRALDVSNNQLASLDGVEALPNLHSLVRASKGRETCLNCIASSSSSRLRIPIVGIVIFARFSDAKFTNALRQPRLCNQYIPFLFFCFHCTATPPAILNAPGREHEPVDFAQRDQCRCAHSTAIVARHWQSPDESRRHRNVHETRTDSCAGEPLFSFPHLLTRMSTGGIAILRSTFHLSSVPRMIWTTPCVFLYSEFTFLSLPASRIHVSTLHSPASSSSL